MGSSSPHSGGRCPTQPRTLRSVPALHSTQQGPAVSVVPFIIIFNHLKPNNEEPVVGKFW